VHIKTSSENNSLVVGREKYFLRAFPEFRKETVNFVMSVSPSVCLSVRPSVRMEQVGSHWQNFS